MEMRNNSRRILSIGFSTQRNMEGEMVGQVMVRLARRNAYELVGLRRPARSPGMLPKD
jgi:hypothetical protein